MSLQQEPFVALDEGQWTEAFQALTRQPVRSTHAGQHPSPGSVVLARLHGFDLLEQPLLSELEALPGQVVAARSTVALRRDMLGCQVLVCCAHDDPLQPIVLGVLAAPTRIAAAVEVDGQRQVIEADREIVLRCGDASITLTRAGKILIQGSYIVSRSTGYNRIKGAAVDIN